LNYFTSQELVNFVEDRKLALDLMLQKTKISSTKPYEEELQNVLLDILKSHDHKMKRESVLRTDKNFNHYFAYRIT
jgi:hypothetical protein